MVGESAGSLDTEELMRLFVREHVFPIVSIRAHSPAE